MVSPAAQGARAEVGLLEEFAGLRLHRGSPARRAGRPGPPLVGADRVVVPLDQQDPVVLVEGDHGPTVPGARDELLGQLAGQGGGLYFSFATSQTIPWWTIAPLDGGRVTPIGTSASQRSRSGLSGDVRPFDLDQARGALALDGGTGQAGEERMGPG